MMCMPEKAVRLLAGDGGKQTLKHLRQVFADRTKTRVGITHIAQSTIGQQRGVSHQGGSELRSNNRKKVSPQRKKSSEPPFTRSVRVVEGVMGMQVSPLTQKIRMVFIFPSARGVLVHVPPRNK